MLVGWKTTSSDGRLPSVEIIKGDQRYIGAVWDLLGRCRSALEAAGVSQWDDVYPTRETVEGDVARGSLFVLEHAGRCVAAVTLDVSQSPEYESVEWTTSEPVLVVHRLCVDPAEQGKGHARRLMDFAEEYAVANGFASIRLDAYTGNERSVDLYRRRGYRAAGQVRFARRKLPFWCFELAVGQPRAGATAQRST